ncbi:hypothetical protein [Chthonobacter rhizosphaerae]|uniref:hypothetical protein n=1 Tax=Chthonobacter rhizosphaerae TaxID=2735553 RepID=UPI0015EF3152|nr:hypothetical protein [Chthonobacter rhizosphaerae]
MAARRRLALLAAAGLALVAGATFSAREGSAEVWLGVQVSPGASLAAILGAPERRPRDLVINGQPLRFTPYRSERPVIEIADEWAATLAAGIRPAIVVDTDPHTAIAAVAATSFLVPRVMKVSDEFATVVHFFDGDGPAALAYFAARTSAEAEAFLPRGSMPGVVVTIRRPAGADATDVLMTRLEEAPAVMSAFMEPVAAEALPIMLQPPGGAEVLMDMSDEGGGHRSRSVVTSGRLAPRLFAESRAALLAASDFDMEYAPARGAALAALRGRNGPLEVDVLYTAGEQPSEVLEVIHLREPLAGRNLP